MRTAEGRGNAVPYSVPAISYVADYEKCETDEQLQVIMDTINRCQYQLISVTQDSRDVFRVFFRRCVLE